MDGDVKMSTFKTLVDAMTSVVANDTSNRASDINNIQNALADIVSGYSSGTLANPGQIVVVAKSGGDFTSLASVPAAITDASASKPYSILLMPGIYETSEVTLPNYVSIVGMDRKSCILKCTSNSEFVVKLKIWNMLTNLTVEHAGTITGKHAKTIVIDDDNSYIINCVIKNNATLSAGSYNAYSIYGGNSSDFYVYSSDIVCVNVGFINGYGISISTEHDPRDFEIRDCSIMLGAGPSGENIGVHVGNIVVNDGFIRGTKIQSNKKCIDLQSTAYVENCYLLSNTNAESTIDIHVHNAKFYNCTVRAVSPKLCFDTDGTYNISIAHCRMNLASPIHANLTNLITTPYNVADTDV